MNTAVTKMDSTVTCVDSDISLSDLAFAIEVPAPELVEHKILANCDLVIAEQPAGNSPKTLNVWEYGCTLTESLAHAGGLHKNTRLVHAHKVQENSTKERSQSGSHRPAQAQGPANIDEIYPGIVY
jgi:hypothetical protein